MEIVISKLSQKEICLSTCDEEIVQCEFVYRLNVCPYCENWLCQFAFCDMQVLQLSTNNSPKPHLQNQAVVLARKPNHISLACISTCFANDSCLIQTHQARLGIQPKCRPNFQQPRSTVATRWRSTAPRSLELRWSARGSESEPHGERRFNAGHLCAVHALWKMKVTCRLHTDLYLSIDIYLYICLSVCLPTYLPISNQSMYQCINHSVNLSLYQSINLSINQSTNQPINQSTYLSNLIETI